MSILNFAVILLNNLLHCINRKNTVTHQTKVKCKVPHNLLIPVLFCAESVPQAFMELPLEAIQWGATAFWGFSTSLLNYPSLSQKKKERKEKEKGCIYQERYETILHHLPHLSNLTTLQMHEITVFGRYVLSRLQYDWSYFKMSLQWEKNCFDMNLSKECQPKQKHLQKHRH